MTDVIKNDPLADVLGSFTNDKATSPSGKKSYPILPDEDGFVAKAVDERGKLHTEMNSLKGRLAKLDGALKERALDHCFRHNENSDKPETTIEIHGSSSSVKVSMTDRYYPITLDSEGKGQSRLDDIKKLVGGPQYSQHVTEGFEVTIMGSDIPLPHRGEFLAAVAQVCKQFSVVPSSKRSATLAKAFHLSRHSTLTPDENAKFHELWPSTISLR
jgi:hypothetical protein